MSAIQLSALTIVTTASVIAAVFSHIQSAQCAIVPYTPDAHVASTQTDASVQSKDDQTPHRDEATTVAGAAERSQVDVMKRLIAEGADVNHRGSQGATPLHRAAIRGPAEAVQVLIDAGAELEAITRMGRTPLGGAAATGNLEIVRILLDAEADVNGGRRMTPLVLATQRPQTEVMELLIEHGAAIDDPRNPPIHWAREAEAAAALIRGGADVDARDGEGQTALHLARGHWAPTDASIEVLIRAGADVDARANDGRTPLLAALMRGRLNTVKRLIDAGADVDARDHAGNTPLSIALSHPEGQPFVEVLRAAGATDDGLTELQRATRDDDIRLIEKLIDEGADVNERGPRRMTALHVASSEGRAEAMDVLIAAGADVNRRDEGGLAPLHVAADAVVAKRLIDAGANVVGDLPGMAEESPLFQALIAGRADVVNVLVEHGAPIEPEFPNMPSMLIWAAFAGRANVVEVLLDRGAKVEAPLTMIEPGRFMRNQSALHVAASGSFTSMASPDHVTPEDRLRIAELLIERGADVSAPAHVGDFEDMVPLHGAAKSGHLEIARLLLEHGADVNATAATGMYAGYTPLHGAARSGHAEMIELLIERGADVNARTTEAYVHGVQTPLDMARSPAVRELLIERGGKSAGEFLSVAG